jgi:hypothetical protein
LKTFSIAGKPPWRTGMSQLDGVSIRLPSRDGCTL